VSWKAADLRVGVQRAQAQLFDKYSSEDRYVGSLFGVRALC
jgi:hypothetical protein